ncbi:hypothetical protein SAMN05443999_101173 [Roseovarius azorensis]|uniref:Lipoprotein n=1 Tax=Roseovarius azorensis TaxID=1287727 RepID=A0A1H7FWM9_9RHOB|nr:hypothetical protein [Roseovarius azorensis]SEK30349.1 hypothetical protein SAMN05443999_101173 [Roseovarius azorensis]
MKHALILSGLVLAACAGLEPQAVARLDNPVLSGGSYDSGGGITVAAEVREHSGQTMVCGVWAQSRQQSVLTNGVEPKVLGSGSVYLDGQALVRGLNFMPEVPPMADYAGQEAGCMLTDRVWAAGDGDKRPVVRIPRQVVYVDADEGGSIIVNFVQSGPGAGEG